MTPSPSTNQPDFAVENLPSHISGVPVRAAVGAEPSLADLKSKWCTGCSSSTQTWRPNPCSGRNVFAVLGRGCA